MEQYTFINQSKQVDQMIESSLYRCSRSGLSPHVDALPTISEEDVHRCRAHVNGQIRLLRNSSPEYYDQITKTLASNDACLLYIYDNFDIYGRFGNDSLRKELGKINFRLGATLSEERIGTNAAVIASRSQDGVWVIGEEHYLDILKDYACYAYQIQGRYGNSCVEMLITHKSNLTQQICELFKLIERTEQIVSAGLVTKEVTVKDLFIRNLFSKRQTDNIIIITDIDGNIIYANDVYYEQFKTEALSIINKNLSQIQPDVFKVVKNVVSGQQIKGQAVTISGNENAVKKYLLDAVPIKNMNQMLGLMFTIYTSMPNQAGTGRREYSAQYNFDDLLGESATFVQLKRFAARIADTMSPVLIQGESGTGKELFAHAIHNESRRRNKPFVAINCAAIPKELIESELFGYVGGSFTGANRNGAKGKLELADGGTLFLDEIGEMPMEMQSVLLRALENNEITPIGGSKPVHVNIRLITATNRDLEDYIEAGKFRADLYYRINVINLKIIPLRERKEDIPIMVNEFIARYTAKYNTVQKTITGEAMKALMDYSWPGNVRELRNAIERGIIVSEGSSIELKNLPQQICGQYDFQELPLVLEIEEKSDSILTQHKRNLVRTLMEKYDGNKTKVAEAMGISRSTLYRILKEDI